MLATEGLAADKEPSTVEETSGLLARIECRSSGSTDRSTAKMYDSLADCFKCTLIAGHFPSKNTISVKKFTISSQY